MKFIRHLVWHDIRALRLPLTAWMLVLLAQAAVMAIGPGVIDLEARVGGLQTFAGFLAGARLAFTILLTVLLVQRDSPVGTTAFWLTRPIPPAAMAASKLCSAALLLVLVPAIVGWILFTALGLPAFDVSDGIWQLILEQVMIVSLAAMGAAITATIPQFAVAAVAAVFIIGTLISEARPYVRGLAALTLGGATSPLARWALVTVLGTGAILIYQYSRRRVVSAAAMVIGVLVLGVLSALTAGAPLDAAPPAPLRAGILDPGALTLDVDPEAVRVESGSTNDARGRPRRYRHADTRLRIAGAPPAIELQPWSIESTWHPSDAPAIRWQRKRAASFRRSVPRGADGDGQPLEGITEALGGAELLKPVRSESTAFQTTLLSLPEEEVSRLKSAQGPLDAAVTLRAWRYRVVDAAPLVVGSTVSARAGRLTVQAIARASGGVQVDVRRVFLERYEWAPEDFVASGIGSSEPLLLRNQARKQAILVGPEMSRQLPYSTVSVIAGRQLGTGIRRLHFVIATADEDRAVLDDEWIAGAELIVLRPEDLGIFTRPLRVEWLNLERAR